MSLIQMAEMSCSDLLREATRMYLLTLCVCAHVLELVLRGVLLTVCGSIYTVHDEVKDKDFELELSWVGEGKLTPPTHGRNMSPPSATGGLHQMVPDEIKESAIDHAKVCNGQMTFT